VIFSPLLWWLIKLVLTVLAVLLYAVAGLIDAAAHDGAADGAITGTGSYLGGLL
jgi:hypothetical protein